MMHRPCSCAIFLTANECVMVSMLASTAVDRVSVDKSFIRSYQLPRNSVNWNIYIDILHIFFFFLPCLRFYIFSHYIYTHQSNVIHLCNSAPVWSPVQLTSQCKVEQLKRNFIIACPYYTVLGLYRPWTLCQT
jgi:hypothetical protein